MTRARERLILSGAARLEALGARALADGVDRAGASESAGRGERGVVGRWRPVPAASCGRAGARRPLGPRRPLRRPRRRGLGDFREPAAQRPPHGARSGPPVSRLSYSSLGEYARCGYRFYAERVLGLPPLPEPPAARRPSAAREPERDRARDPRPRAAREARLPPAGGADRGRDHARGASARRAPPRRSELGALIELFIGSELCARLSAAADVPPRGALRVPARERRAR